VLTWRKQRSELNLPNLEIFGGKDCEAVTTTPKHGEGFALGDIAVKGLHTPCHTQDSICWFAQDGDDRVVFTGDTLFHGGCGKFFEGNGAEMHRALNVTLASLPDDTRVFVGPFPSRRGGEGPRATLTGNQPGHEYTKSNAKFAISVLQSEPVRKLQEFAAQHKETQGKFTIGDEKASKLALRTAYGF